jgi:hypothetical protein
MTASGARRRIVAFTVPTGFVGHAMVPGRLFEPPAMLDPGAQVGRL